MRPRICCAASLVLALAPAWAQPAKPVAAKVAPDSPAAIGPAITPQSFVELENRFDTSLRRLNEKDPIDILGATRSVYLRDYGVVFSTELSLIVTPSVNPFRKEITKEEAARVHQRKLAQLPLLKKSMKEMARSAAMAVTTAVGLQRAASSRMQVVYAVRLLYLPYEDTTGLPAQLLIKANLADAFAGDINVEEQ